MKKVLLSLFILVGLNSIAQSPCDSLTFYGVEEDFTVYASPSVTSIIVSGNWEGESVILVEANENVVGVYNNNPTNMQAYESLIICTFSPNTSCCDTYVWDGQTWVIEAIDNTSSWSCSVNGFGCSEFMDGSGDFASEEECIASCDSIIYCNGSVEITEENGQLTANVYDMTLPVTYEWSNLENTQSITPSSYGVYTCYIVDANGCSYSEIFSFYDFDFCDSTWYNADFAEVDGLWEVTLTGYINESLNDLTDTVVHGFVITPSNDFMSQYGGAGSYPHSWTPEFALSLSLADTLTVCWNASIYADGLNAFPQGYSEMCNMNQEICDEWFWDGEAWARSTSGTSSIGDLNIKEVNLLKVIDALGRVVDKKSTNKLLFYIYDNGQIEKKFNIE